MKPIGYRTQRGVVLFVALIVLVAMTLAGIALMRNVDSGTVIAGNLSFRQVATYAGDLGTEAARNWLTGTTINLDNDSSTNAYYATWQANLDLLGNDPDPAKTDFDWSTAITATGSPTGYTVRYVIHRLCDSVGGTTSSSCVKTTGAASSATASTKGAANYGTLAISVSTSALYRVTVRVDGPRNTLSYIQSSMY